MAAGAPVGTSLQTCPRCREENNCALAAGKEASTCWCMAVTMDPQRMAPFQHLGQCLCRRCAESAAAPAST